jgi:hypothetical protein
MSIYASAINLQFGNQAHSYQDLIPFTIGNTPIMTVPFLTFASYRCCCFMNDKLTAPNQIIKSDRQVRSCRAAVAATAKSRAHK